MTTLRLLAGITGTPLLAIACGGSRVSQPDALGFQPREVIDLGAAITEDLAERVWGQAMLVANRLDRPDKFEVVEWAFGSAERRRHDRPSRRLRLLSRSMSRGQTPVTFGV